MVEISELATAVWRLGKWLNSIETDRKMAAKSSLRVLKRYLEEKEIEIIDLTGSKFDEGLAVSVVNNEAEEDATDLVILETVKPIILCSGAVIQYGQVIIGKPVAEEESIEKTDKTESADGEQNDNQNEKKVSAAASIVAKIRDKIKIKPLDWQKVKAWGTKCGQFVRKVYEKCKSVCGLAVKKVKMIRDKKTPSCPEQCTESEVNRECQEERVENTEKRSGRIKAFFERVVGIVKNMLMRIAIRLKLERKNK